MSLSPFCLQQNVYYKGYEIGPGSCFEGSSDLFCGEHVFTVSEAV